MLIFIIIATFLSLFFGMTILSLAAFTYWKSKNSIILSFLVFFGLLTAHMIYEAVINYIYLNNYHVYIDSFPIIYAISLLFTYSLFFTLILFTNVIIGFKRIVIISILVALLLIAIFPLDYYSFDYLNSNGEYSIKTYKDLHWTDFFHLIPFLYPITILMHRKKISVNSGTLWLGKRLAILILISIPALINDVLRFFIFDLSFTPIIYVLFSLLLLRYLIKFYHSKEVVKIEKLSNRERELATLIVEGKTNSEISEELFISISTVKNHIYNIYKKLGIKNRYELIKKTSK